MSITPSTLGAGMDGFQGMARNIPTYLGSHQFNNSPWRNRSTYGPVDQLMLQIFGEKMYPIPQPNSNQSIYDAFWRRSRDMELLKVRNDAVANMMIFKKMGGINQNGMLFNLASSFINNPDSPITQNILSPIIGGNPIRAQMAAYANLRGLNMATFGSTQDLTPGESTRLMDVLYKRFYNTKEIDDATLGKGRDRIMTNARKRGVSEDLLNRLGSLFESDGSLVDNIKDATGKTITETKYGRFKQDTDAIAKFESGLNAFDLKSKQGIDDARKAAQELIGNLSDTTMKNKVSKAVEEAIAKGTTEAFRNNKDIADIRKTAMDAELHSTLVKGGTAYTGINFLKTYGFNIEDLSSARDAAVQYNMISGRKGLMGASADFFDKGVGLMDAGRSFFGNDKTGREIMEAMNDFLGVSGVDVSDQSQATKLTNLLFDIQGFARNANVSLDFMKEIIAQGKAVAANTEGLQYLGGMEVGELALNVGSHVAALTSVMDPKSIRRMGGKEGIMSSMMMGQLQKASEPITQQVGALHTYFNGNPFAQRAVTTYAATGDHTWQGFQNFALKLATKTSTDYYDMMSYANNNEVAANEGIANSAAIRNVGNKASMDTYRQMLYKQNGGGARGQAALDALNAAISSRSVDFDEYMGMWQQDTDATTKAYASRVAYGLQDQRLRQHGINTVEDFMNADSSVKQQFVDLNKNVQQMQSRLRNRVLDRFDMRGNMIYKANDAFLNQNSLVNNEHDVRLQEDVIASRFNVSRPLVDMAKDVVNSGAITYDMMRTDPFYLQNKAAVDARNKADREMTKMLNQKLGFLNTKTTTQFIDKMLSGEVDREGFTAFFEPLGIKDNTSSLAYKTFEDLKSIGTANNFEDVAKGLEGLGVKGVTSTGLQSISDLSKKLNLTGDQLQQIAESKGDYTTISKIVGRNYKGSLTNTGAENVYQMSLQAKELGLNASYKGKFDLENIKKHLTGTHRQKFIDAAVQPMIAENEKAYDDRMQAIMGGKIKVSSQTRNAAAVLAGYKIDDAKKFTDLLESTGVDKEGKVLPVFQALGNAMGLGKEKGSDLIDKVKANLKDPSKLDVNKYAETDKAIRAAGAEASKKTDNEILTDIQSSIEKLPDMIKELITEISKFRDAE